MKLRIKRKDAALIRTALHHLGALTNSDHQRRLTIITRIETKWPEFKHETQTLAPPPTPISAKS